MYSCGRGFHGQLGLETYDNREAPQRVGACLPWEWMVKPFASWPSEHEPPEPRQAPVEPACNSPKHPARAPSCRWAWWSATSTRSACTRASQTTSTWRSSPQAAATRPAYPDGEAPCSGLCSPACGPLLCAHELRKRKVPFAGQPLASSYAVLSRRGELYTWGLASSGELGHGGWTPIEVSVPRMITSLQRTRIVSVACGANHTLAISETGQLWSCGRGRHGQVCTGLGWGCCLLLVYCCCLLADQVECSAVLPSVLRLPDLMSPSRKLTNQLHESPLGCSWATATSTTRACCSWWRPSVTSASCRWRRGARTA